MVKDLLGQNEHFFKLKRIEVEDIEWIFLALHFMIFCFSFTNNHKCKLIYTTRYVYIVLLNQTQFLESKI